MLGGGRSWYEKLPCENACLAILVCFLERFRWQFHFKHFSEDVRLRLQICAFQLNHFHVFQSVRFDAVILADFSCPCDSL